MSLSRLAEKWRQVDEPGVDFSHDLHIPSRSTDQVDQTFKVRELLDDKVDQPSRSGRSPSDPPGELTSWLHEEQQPGPSPWGFTPEERRDNLNRLRHIPAFRAPDPQPFIVPVLPGVPPEWCAGVYRLQDVPTPGRIDPTRWVRFRYDALRLLHEHGAALHAAGWDPLNLFGLHRNAPDRRPDGMGVAWLMRKLAVAAVTAEAVSLVTAAGVGKRVFRMGETARLEAVVAWELGQHRR